ncbi:MAG: metallophosphoesterase [Oscillospiraceae bacterium]|nr:metallophosphoesterase [Oscillospiraceae bacterium]
MRRRRRGGFFWLLMLALLVYAFIYSNTKVVLREYEVSSPDLPSAFSGTRAAVVSDTHGKFDQRTLDAVFDADPDIILLAGDIIDDDSQIPAAADFVGSLVGRAPTYFVTGNHEWATDAAREFISKLTLLGVHVMDARAEYFEKDGGRIVIAGLPDPTAHGDNPSPAAVLEITKDDFVLLLSHRPADPDIFAEYGTDVIVSGHVHGGMVRLPGLGGIIGPGREFLPKLDGSRAYKGANGSTLIVSRGLAGVKFYSTQFHFPRLFNPREVVLITLTKG